jgi:hypothetical protein
MNTQYDRNIYQEMALIDDMHEKGFLDDAEAQYLKETW